jgi:hypothetical protein
VKIFPTLLGRRAWELVNVRSIGVLTLLLQNMAMKKHVIDWKRIFD